MINNSLNAGLLLLVVTIFAACSNPSGDLPISSAISDANDAKKALVSLQQYNDTANIAWKELEEADSVKIADIERLILEFSYARGMLSPKDFSDLEHLLAKAKASHLAAADQFNKTALKKYDEVTDTLADKTLRTNAKLKLANKVKPIMAQLVESIDQDENIVIVKRAMYDDAAKKYNDYFSRKKSILLQLDSTISAKPARAYFDSNSSL